MVSLLIDSKADVNAQSETGRALLHVAVDEANKTQPLDTSIIEALLKVEGINVNAVDKDGKTPLHEAAKSYNQQIVTVLLEAKGIYVTPLDNTRSTPLNLASQQGRQHIVKILEETQKDIEALYSAVKSDNYEEVQSLLSKKVNVNSIDNDGKTLLHFAAIKGNVEIVRALIQTGADVNIADKDGRVPLFEAAFYGHKDATEVLLNNGAKVDTVMESLLQSMMEYNYNSSHKDIVKALLNKGANADAVDSYGHTLLHWAAREGYTDIAELLLEKGANVNIQDNDLWTPLHFATKNKVFMGYADRPANASAETVKFLIKKGADVNIENEDGNTPFKLATDEGIKTLLQPAEKSDDSSAGGSSTDSEGGQEEEKRVGDDTELQSDNSKEGEKTSTTSAEQGTDVQDNDVGPVASTEPAQTEEQPSSFFGSLFSILMKPFSLIASFFGGFFSWLFGSDEEKSDTQPYDDSSSPGVDQSVEQNNGDHNDQSNVI